MRHDNRDFTEQEAVNAGMPVTAFGGTLLTRRVRGVHSNVTRSFRCTTANGTRVVIAMNVGTLYPYRLIGISGINGAAISSASALVIPIL